MKMLGDGRVIGKEIGIITVYTSCIRYASAASQAENEFCDYLGRVRLLWRILAIKPRLKFSPRRTLPGVKTQFRALCTPADYL